MPLLEIAIQIAVLAHSRQKDKFDRPFILHPLRMLTRMGTEEEQIVAVLHDVVEKSEWTLEDLKHEGFGPEILVAVDCLTRREDEAYLDYIRRARANPLAKKVKASDLQDHLDSLREFDLIESSPARAARYAEAMAELTKDT